MDLSSSVVFSLQILFIASFQSAKVTSIYALALAALQRIAGLLTNAMVTGLLAAGSAAPPIAAKPDTTQTAVLAGGCFWGLEAVFEQVKGVSDVASGYAGGSRGSADYQQVSSRTTGHAEAVKITYNPDVVSDSQLLNIYFSIAHDPTELNRQGPDVGTQYRSAIFFTDQQDSVPSTDPHPGGAVEFLLTG